MANETNPEPAQEDELRYEPLSKDDVGCRTGVRERGMLLEFKRVDQLWKDLRMQVIPTGTNEQEYDSYVFLVRRNFDWDNKFEGITIVIYSKHLRDAVLSIMGSVKGISLVDETPEIPSNTLFFYTEEIKAYIETLSAETLQAEHCRLLLRYLQEDYKETRMKLKGMMQEGIITFDLVWVLFKPGTIAVARTDSSIDDYRCFIVDNATKDDRVDGRKKHKERYVVYGRYVSMDGEKLGYGELVLHIDRFKGTKAIAKLPAYPLRHCNDLDTVKASLISRGKIFVGLLHQRGVVYSYNDMAVIDATKNEKRHFEGRVVLDPLSHRKYNNEGANYPILDDLDSADSSEYIFTTSNGQAFTEEQLLVSAPCVAGFSLSENCWALFYLSRVHRLQWDGQAFGSLVLKQSTKVMIQGLIASHMKPNVVLKDIIEGKGEGVVLVLHGPPGTGKTLTAELVAEHLQAPLYSVSAGELGTDAKEVELNLKTMFHLAHAWGAVLLIDEADVFLEQRGGSDAIKRNALVGMFLRTLEYYRGVLIMTTNRLQYIDSAMASRINLCIEYKALGRKERGTLWELFIRKAMDQEHSQVGEIAGFSAADLEEFTKEQLNGREIKNIVKLAKSNALLESKSLSGSYIMVALSEYRQMFEGFRGLMTSMYV